MELEAIRSQKAERIDDGKNVLSAVDKRESCMGLNVGILST